VNCSGRFSGLTLWPTGHSRYWMLFHVSSVREGNLLKVLRRMLLPFARKVASYPIWVKVSDLGQA
jgi:hypothetical protein